MVSVFIATYVCQCMVIIGWHIETDVEKERFCVPEYHEGITECDT